MSTLVNLGVVYGSRRYARDIIESRHNTITQPWWDFPRLRAFSADPNPDREPRPWDDPIWITIGTGSVPPDKR